MSCFTLLVMSHQGKIELVGESWTFSPLLTNAASTHPPLAPLLVAPGGGASIPHQGGQGPLFAFCACLLLPLTNVNDEKYKQKEKNPLPLHPWKLVVPKSWAFGWFMGMDNL